MPSEWTKTLRFMKLICFFFFIGLVHVSASVYSQSKKLTLEIYNKTVLEVLDEIEKQSEFRFAYTSELVDLQRKVTVDLTDKNIQEALDIVLQGTEIIYTVQDRHIMLYPKALDVLSNSKSDIDQHKIVTGKVTDSSGLPLPGVTVMIKGTSSGTVTNVEGGYSLTNIPENSVLVFSFVGMKTQEISVAKNSTVNVTLVADAIGIEEVVAIGYGTLKKSDLTGSVASVKVADMVEAKSMATFESMLQGQVSGLQVINSNNDNPQGGAIVRIRGMSSLNGSNSPLVVVDGIPIGDAGSLQNINPSNIKSIEVLKDASSTAIYGSRGANGVIMVTTKRGNTGAPSINIDHKTNIGFFSEKLDYWRDPVEMMELTNEAYINAEVEPLYNGEIQSTTGIYYPSLNEVESGAWPYHTIWKDYVFRDPSVSNETTLGIQGGTDKNQYNMNFTYYTGEGMSIGNDFDKFLMDLSYNNQVANFLNIETRAGFLISDRNNIYSSAYQRNPLFPVYNGDGTPYKISSTDYANPVGLRENVLNGEANKQGYATIQMDIDIAKSLKLVLRGDGRASYAHKKIFNPEDWTLEGDKWNNYAQQTRTSLIKILFDGYLTYSKTIAKGHNLTAMTGVSMDQSNQESLTGVGKGYSSTVLTYENLVGGETLQTWNNSVKTVLLSGFGRINYNFKGKYYATFTARADGSSKFGANNKWGYFPSGALSWRMSEENFLKEIKIIDDLKLRASYGISGNQGISAYQTNTVYGYTYIGYGDGDVLAYGPGEQVGLEGLNDRYITWGGIGNASLRWEKTAQFNVGLDASLFGKINLNLDLYRKLTSDLLREQFIAPNTGFDRMWINGGEIENKGFEIALDGQIFHNDKWQVDGGITYSMNRNKVLDLGDETASDLNTDTNGMQYEFYGAMSGSVFQDSYYSILAIGQPVGVFYGYKVDGIIQETPSNATNMTQAGEFNYVGLTEDGSLDSDSKSIIGDPNPDFIASLNLSIKHKSGFDLSMQWYTVFGNDIISRTKLNRTDLQKYRWTSDNPSTTRPSLRSDRYYYLSDWFVEDGSYLRLQNITLGYTLPRIPVVQAGRIYVSGNNLLTFTNSTQYDPEIGEEGLGDASYPRIAICTIGVQLTF